MHVAWGRQLLYGRQPLLDMEALGLPLQASISAIVERLVGYRLISEGLIVAGAFGLGATLTFAAARAAAGSVAIGIGIAALQVAVAPRSYSYPKIVAYAAAILLLWRYIERPSNHRAVVLGIGAAVAFYLRHDHGLYVGLVTLAVLVLRHSSDWPTVIRRFACVGSACVVLLGPYFIYIERQVGVIPWAQNLRGIAEREYQQNKFDSWPRWPLARVDDVVSWQENRPSSATIGVRWNAGASDELRRAAAARYGLQLAQETPIESGRFLLTDVSTRNVLAMLADPAIEDTAGIDRRAGTVPLQGLWLGPVHMLSGLDSPFASAALFFFGIIALLLLTLTALATQYRGSSGSLSAEWLKIAAVVLIGIATTLGFIREPLAMRIPDAIVAPAILAAWWAGKTLGRLRSTSRAAVRIGGAIIAAAVLILVTRSTVVLGAPSTRLDAMRHLPRIARQLMATPPIDVVGAESRVKYKAIRYVRDCTAQNEPLLVLWYAPDLYYYSDRPFAGRLPFYMEGYWSSERLERQNIDVIERDRPAIALIESDREVTDLYTYPHLSAYLAESYHQIGTLSSEEDRTIRVLARNDRIPASIDPGSGWPCYR